MNIKFIVKLLISISVFSVIAAVAPVDAMAGNAKDHDRLQSHKIAFSKLTINPVNSQLLNQPLHFCPVHGRIMKGAFCKMKQMKHASANDPEPDSKDKEECFVLIDDMGLPAGPAAEVLHLDYKFDLSTMSDMALTQPSSIFNCSDFKVYSQEYFNTLDKPPEYLS
tara:strand:- start:2049 stop:2546 length:498 start_codon:yes stop_codon:yes gene_type:complete